VPIAPPVPPDEVDASLARRKRERRRAGGRAWAALFGGLVLIGGAFSGLVYAARRAVDGFPDLNFELDGPTPEALTTFAPVEMGRAPQWAVPMRALASSPPAVADGRVFVRDRNGTVSAVDAATGAALWRADVGGGPTGIDFAPVVDRGVVYVSGGDWALSQQPTVVALDAATGVRRWEGAVGASGLGGFPITVADDDVYIDGDQFVALDRETGARRWTAPVGNTTTSGYSQPSVTADTVFVGGGDGQVHAFDRRTGRPRWSVPAGDHSTLGAGPTVAVSGALVYVVSAGTAAVPFGDDKTSGRLQALDAATGAERWSQPLAGLPAFGSSPAVYGAAVYVAADELKAFDATTGVPRWSAPSGGTTPYSFVPLRVVNGAVLVPGGDGRLHAVDAATGVPRWSVGGTSPCTQRRGCDPPVPVPPAVAGGVLYLASGDARLYAYPP
jgi:outer membrane protein assembly factor BamB